MGWRKGLSRSGQHLPAQEDGKRICDREYFGLEKAFKGLQPSAVSGDIFNQMRLL